MPMEEGSGYCDDCRRSVLLRRETPNHLIHGLVTLFLCGLWAPVWIIVAMNGNGPWRCTKCGYRV